MHIDRDNIHCHSGVSIIIFHLISLKLVCRIEILILTSVIFHMLVIKLQIN